MNYVLLRPKLSEKSRFTFRAVESKSVNTRTHRKLGLYDPDNGRVEEWCFKEDFEHFDNLRKQELEK